jgi:hypothetical protein
MSKRSGQSGKVASADLPSRARLPCTTIHQISHSHYPGKQPRCSRISSHPSPNTVPPEVPRFLGSWALSLVHRYGQSALLLVRHWDMLWVAAVYPSRLPAAFPCPSWVVHLQEQGAGIGRRGGRWRIRPGGVRCGIAAQVDEGRPSRRRAARCAVLLSTATMSDYVGLIEILLAGRMPMLERMYCPLGPLGRDLPWTKQS